MRRSRDAADSDLSRGDTNRRGDSLARRAAWRFVELRLSPGRTDAGGKRHGVAAERRVAGAVQCGGGKVWVRSDERITPCAPLGRTPKPGGTVSAGRGGKGGKENRRAPTGLCHGAAQGHRDVG